MSFSIPIRCFNIEQIINVLELNLLKIDVSKFGKWFYKAVKMTIVGLIIIILIIISIILFNEKVIAFVSSF